MVKSISLVDLKMWLLQFRHLVSSKSRCFSEFCFNLIGTDKKLFHCSKKMIVIVLYAALALKYVFAVMLILIVVSYGHNFFRRGNIAVNL